MPENSYIEVRILKTQRGTVSGYFNDVEKMLSALKRYDGTYNIFFTLNQPIVGIESRSINRLKEYAQNTTTDSEIAKRNWILVDLDPVRPSGISSTDEELKQAEMLSDKIREYLSAAGFPEPVTAMSGNGYHLLYAINMPNDEESKQLIKDFLKRLDNSFSNESVKVDIANYNAARITKLYGTMACKGDSTNERPHRRSKILYIPDDIVEVSAVQIETILQKHQNETKAIHKNSTSKNGLGTAIKNDKSFSVEDWLNKHQITVSRTKTVENGICYVLDECPWNHEHSRDKGAYVIQYENGKIIAGCHHDSCREQGVNWESLWRMKEGNKSLPHIKSKKSADKVDNLKESQADILLNILEERGHDYFKNKKGDTFVQVQEEGCPVNYPLNSELYRLLITGIYYKTIQKSIRKDAVNQVLDTLTAKASVEGKIYETYKRFGMFEGKLYYLLADVSNTVLCISPKGIEICKEPPVRLIKRKSMLTQPMPLEGKSLLELLQKYYSFSTKNDEILHAVILVTRLITNIEQPIVIYTGPKGSYKTTSMDMDKRILDYSSANVSVLPKNEEDFVLVLNSQDILCFDNIDNITKAQVDIFCQVLSESVVAKRKKYTDDELCEINIKATVYMTGINLLSGRTDFLSRCIFINTKASGAKDGGKKSKKLLMEEFEKDKPYILFGVFTVLSKAISIYDKLGEIKMNDRLIDFLQWGYAVAEAMGYGGEAFLKAYKKNRQGIDEETLAADEVANAVMTYLEKYDRFSGTMTELSNKLTEMISDETYIVSNKIKNPIQLSKRLGELTTGFDAIGINVDIGKKNHKRYVILQKGHLKTK